MLQPSVSRMNLMRRKHGIAVYTLRKKKNDFLNSFFTLNCVKPVLRTLRFTFGIITRREYLTAPLP